jgi:hypothetical protein
MHQTSSREARATGRRAQTHQVGSLAESDRFVDAQRDSKNGRRRDHSRCVVGSGGNVTGTNIPGRRQMSVENALVHETARPRHAAGRRDPHKRGCDRLRHRAGRQRAIATRSSRVHQPHMDNAHAIYARSSARCPRPETSSRFRTAITRVPLSPGGFSGDPKAARKCSDTRRAQIDRVSNPAGTPGGDS